MIEDEHGTMTSTVAVARERLMDNPGAERAEVSDSVDHPAATLDGTDTGSGQGGHRARPRGRRPGAGATVRRAPPQVEQPRAQRAHEQSANTRANA
jgi:hypothetical protein